MKKSVVIILAVAIIGVLGVKTKHNTAAQPSAQAQAANTSSQSMSPMQSSGNTSPPASQSTTSAFKDGTYTGASEDTMFGTVQVAVVVSGGKITDVQFLQMPHDMGHSQEVSAYAEPYLKDETIQSQSASIQFVSGASTTSAAYEQSLQAALNQAA